MRIALFLPCCLALVLSGYPRSAVSSEAILCEDFEALGAELGERAELSAAGAWKNSAFGKNPGLVREADHGFLLASSSGGDHHAYWVPDPAVFRSVVSSGAFYLELSTRGSVRVALGDCREWKVTSAVSLRIGDSAPALTDAEGGAHVGLDQPNSSSWTRVGLLCRRPAESAERLNVTLILTGSDGVRRRVAGLDNVALPLGAVLPETWNGVDLRLDGKAGVDDLALRAIADPEAFLSGISVSEARPAFKALLDEVVSPRAAEDLGGVWEYTAAASTVLPPQDDAVWRPVLVPAQHESLFKGDVGRVWFRRTFATPELAAGMRAVLKFEGITDTCDVYVNQVHVLRHEQDWTPFEADITDVLQGADDNQLLVGVLPPRHAAPWTDRPVGWGWYAATFTGITFPVHLLLRPEVYVSEVFIRPSLHDGGVMTTDVTVRNLRAQDVTLAVGATVGEEFGHAPRELRVPKRGTATVTLQDAWANPPLWWPHDPQLRYLDTALTADGVVVDTVRTRFGFRELGVRGVDLMLNGRRFLHRRDSVITYWPRMQESALREYFSRLRERGYNGARLHGGGSIRVMRVADEMGMLLGMESSVNEPRGHQVSEVFWSRASDHLEKLVRLYQNYPSIAYWCVSNEFGSAYMGKDSPPQLKEWVDGWLSLMGQRIQRIDPTRTVTFCGDLELGGIGRHGPSPNLSLHYPWQPYKPSCQIPRTVSWLEDGGRPWQGIVWDKTKPVFMNECLYPEYEWNPPHGMAQWAGDSVYDDEGYYRAWFDALRMFAAGYYHAKVACVNPWATQAGNADAPLFKYGQPFPDFLLATREFDEGFSGGAKAFRTLCAYNQTFRDLTCTLNMELIHNRKTVWAESSSFDLIGGGMKELPVNIPMPAVNARTVVTWRVRLSAGEEMLTERDFPYVVYPATLPVTPPADCALVTGDAAFLADVTFAAGRFTKVEEALAKQPKHMILAGIGLSTPEERALSSAVLGGMKVLMVDMPAETKLPAPLRMIGGQFGFYAFLRSSHDPLLAGLEDADLRLWGSDLEVTRNALIKPDNGVGDILIDAATGDGLTISPLLRIRRGKGHYVFCQFPLVSKRDLAPSRYLLSVLVERFADSPAIRSATLACDEAMASNGGSQLKTLRVPYSSDREKDAPVLWVGGKDRKESDVASWITKAKSGVTVLVQNADSSTAQRLTSALGGTIQVETATIRKACRSGNSALLDGLSNADFYWVQKKKTSGKESTRDVDDALATSSLTLSGNLRATQPLTPSLLAEIPVGAGRIILCQVQWDSSSAAFPVQSRRVLAALLKNCGVPVGEDVPVMREFRPLDLSGFANRGFHDQPERKDLPRGWFGGGEDDLRYFPVNLTGIDPYNDMPQPKEEFPVSAMYYAGIPFRLVNPEDNGGKSCLVLSAAEAGGGLADLKVPGTVDGLWFLGALEKMMPRDTAVLSVSWQYEDGSREDSKLQAGADLQGYQYAAQVSGGMVGWRGNTKKYIDAVLWTWKTANPHPEKLVKSVLLRADGACGVAITGVTLEVQKK